MEPQKEDWRPTANLSSLQRRSEVVWQIRSFFRSAGFWEVHTPVLSQDTILDRHIEPLCLPGETLAIPGHEEKRFYLQTSPEFAMKRLLAAGAERIYQIGPVFRGGERGPLHNPEFTMLEWYRCNDDLDGGIDLLYQLIQYLMPDSKPLRLSYQAAFMKYVGICPLSSDEDELFDTARKHQLTDDRNWSHDRDDWLNLLFAELVQPHLGIVHPTIVTHYPGSQSALARISNEDPRVAERYELFWAGIELANGYHELLDPVELQRRTAVIREQRGAEGKQPLRENSRLVEAMKAGLPSCSGCALGLDRLVMVLENATSIDQVISFPIERA